jgi:hypothetical protein
LDDGPVKIGAGPVIPEAGMQDAQQLAVGGAEFVAAEALVVPDVLQQAFRGMQRVVFAQEETSLLLRAPLRIKIRPESGHGIRFESSGGKVKTGVRTLILA